MHRNLLLVASIAILSTFAAATASASVKHTASGKSAAATLDLGVLGQLNQIRRQHGLVPLTLSPGLGEAARAHSRDMLAHGYFAHTSSNGSQFWQRIRGFYAEGPSGYWSVGENLWWTSGSATATEGMQAWMASPEHRANILDPAWRQIGIAAVSAGDAPGTYGGLGVTVITTDFGVRR